jgi:hypothetical protein
VIAGIDQQILERTMKEISDDTWLRREEAAKALTEHGFKIAGATLATRASRGNGPPYRTFNNYALYEWGTTLAWAQNELSKPRRVAAKDARVLDAQGERRS